MVVAAPRFLIAGLGNQPWPLTRHSVGHLALDSLASRLGTTFVSERACFVAHASVCMGDYPIELTLIKPKTFMNLSGKPVVNQLRKASLPPSRLIVVHDSLYHKPNTVSPKAGGSANGHNGIRDIIAALGGDTNFQRLRLGIGKNTVDAAEYVMGKLSESELEFWGPQGRGMDLVWKALQTIIRQTLRPG
ncbi:peptidyl-tRNA hydrolase [Panus rudis PR-1116 ss-1]|nr:peptidyl-tRNA hydrolase [Panus rudis PR-1116 ss-1]